MAAYLDEMDGARAGPDPDVPVRRLIAALGPQMLGVAVSRALGAHTYFVPVEHTARARELLGPEPVLGVEQTAIMSSDPAAARGIARPWAADYLELPNYANNWRRFGFGEDDVTGAGSDRLLDAAFAWGSPETIAARVREHLDAGADHVCVQVIGAPDGDAETDVRRLAEMAPALLSL